MFSLRNKCKAAAACICSSSAGIGRRSHLATPTSAETSVRGFFLRGIFSVGDLQSGNSLWKLEGTP